MVNVDGVAFFTSSRMDCKEDWATRSLPEPPQDLGWTGHRRGGGQDLGPPWGCPAPRVLRDPGIHFPPGRTKPASTQSA